MITQQILFNHMQLNLRLIKTQEFNLQHNSQKQRLKLIQIIDIIPYDIFILGKEFICGWSLYLSSLVTMYQMSLP